MRGREREERERRKDEERGREKSAAAAPPSIPTHLTRPPTIPTHLTRPPTIPTHLTRPHAHTRTRAHTHKRMLHTHPSHHQPRPAARPHARTPAAPSTDMHPPVARRSDRAIFLPVPVAPSASGTNDRPGAQSRSHARTHRQHTKHTHRLTTQARTRAHTHTETRARTHTHAQTHNARARAQRHTTDTHMCVTG